VDLRAAGAFGAVQTLLNALNVLLVGTVNIAGPMARVRLVRDGYDEWKRWLFLVGSALTGLTIVLTALLAAFAEPLLALLFRPEYAHYALLVPLLGVATVLRGPNSILAIAFRTAEKPQVGFAAKTASAAVTLAAAYPMLHAWGLYGAALGIVITQLCWMAVYSRHVFLKGTLSRENVAPLFGVRAG
jgi:O-antigen/teichoic acid export membrane protein